MTGLIMIRTPYMDPQTSLEREIAALVEELKNGRHNRSGFAAMIERVMANAFSLHAALARVTADNAKLEKMLAVNMPTVTAHFSETPQPTTLLYCYDWRIEPIFWRAYLKPFQARADEEGWRRIRRRTYWMMARLFRKEFERTFPKSAKDLDK